MASIANAVFFDGHTESLDRNRQLQSSTWTR
jgi:prepilin-type processing-associated H-X9-DG protein